MSGHVYDQIDEIGCIVELQAAIPLLCTPKLLSQKGPVEPITVCAIDFRLAA